MKSDAEMRALSEAESVWPVVGVLNYLQALVDKSHIIDALNEPGELCMVVRPLDHTQFWLLAKSLRGAVRCRWCRTTQGHRRLQSIAVQCSADVGLLFIVRPAASACSGGRLPWSIDSNLASQLVPKQDPADAQHCG